jgi:hypothetical protein
MAIISSFAFELFPNTDATIGEVDVERKRKRGGDTD